MKPINFLLFVFFLTAYHGIGQEINTKGSQSLKPKRSLKKEKTRAVVIGVSDYLDEQIPDLEFAHKDAQAFADYLQSPAGGSLSSQNLKILLNETATGGNVHAALDWLKLESKKGDKCFIYFSGHGDVETLFENEPGHFLVHDSPSETYQINSLRVEDLQTIVKQLTNEVEAKVIVITDACRSGKLAGSAISGAQATAAAFLNQFSNEVKIMSCQADEFSYEGEQWGGGRGMFSYHLIKGLKGLADRNENDQVNSMELQRHLEDNFELDLMDARQTPVFVGDRRAVLAHIHKESLKAIEEQESEQKLDSDAALMDQFYTALKSNNLIEDEQNSALYFLNLLETKNSDPARIAIAKGDLIAGLQNDAHQAINKYLSLDPEEVKRRWNEDGSQYFKYAMYLEKAAELLGEFHYIYPQIKAKAIYFDVVAQRIDLFRSKAKPENYEKLIKRLEQALVYQPRSPFINNEMGVLFTYLKKYDQALNQFNIALEISPTWALPYNNIGSVYYSKYQIDTSIEWFQKCIELNPEFSEVYSNLYYSFMDKGDFKNAEKSVRKLLSFYPNHPNYSNDLSFALIQQKNWEEAIEILDQNIISYPKNELSYLNKAYAYELQEKNKKALSVLNEVLIVNPNNVYALRNKGRVCSKLSDYTSSIKELLKAIEIDPKSNARIELAKSYLHTNRIREAKEELDYYLDNINAKSHDALFLLACVAALQDNFEAFDRNLSLAIDNGFKNKIPMEESTFLSSIRTKEVYKKHLARLNK